MKNSIRFKLFIGISIFIIFIIGLSWVLNTQYLDKYYLYKKKNILIDYVKEIDEIYLGSIDNIEDKLNTIESNINGSISIFSQVGDVKYSSQFSQRMGGMGQSQKNSPWRPTISKEGLLKVLEGEIVFETYHHNKLKADFLTMGYKLFKEDIILIQIPLAAIQEGAKVANNFYLFIGLLAITLSMIFAFIYAKKFTRPIIELNDVTNSLAELDFNKKSQINTKDELGELAKNINYLSDKLDSTITELNDANKKLQKDIEKERKIDEMRKKFVSNVSHELKTPISLIQGYAEGLKDSVMEEQESKEYYCDVIIDEADKMDKLVKDLLDLSQLESGYLKLNKEVFDIIDLVNSTVKKYRPIFDEKGINVSVDEAQEIMINADISRIEQVLKNYINNAINHVDDKKTLRISFEESDKKIKVNVFNTGKPVPKDEINNLWMSFYKVDKARSRKYGGTGLGLAIVRSILILHDAEFGVSNKDNGVEFWFKLEKNNY